MTTAVTRTIKAVALEWTNVDKSEWGDGPWQHEPDKKQWVDAATDLDCLIVRNHDTIGALCGYVGVPEGHPAFGIHYSRIEVDVHGGLTFSASCHEASREAYERWREYMIRVKPEIDEFPKGDAALAWRTQGHMVNNYEAWAEYSSQRSICHTPIGGRPDKVWWLGFDCGHYRDYAPGMMALLIRIGSPVMKFKKDDVYRTIAYVENEIAHLAKQLADVKNLKISPPREYD